MNSHHSYGLPLLISTLFSIIFAISISGPPQISDSCLNANKKCEENTDCIHRLAVLQSACVTNTCQPQCREAAFNLYQNKEGRQLLRTDASCVPGRYELEKCGFLPNRIPKHCSFAKLICETDLQCNSRWEVFVSECETETNGGQCSEKCQKYLDATVATQSGADLRNCTCTDKEDDRCIQLKEFTLKPCLQQNDRDGNRPLPRPKTTVPSEHLYPSDEGATGTTAEMPRASAPRSVALPLGALTLSLLSLLFARYCLFHSGSTH